MGDLEDYDALTKGLRHNELSAALDEALDEEEEEKRSETSLARVNRVLISGYGVKSAAQLSEETGIPAGDIAKRQQELFASIDILDIQQRRVKLMLQLEDMVSNLQERLAQSSDRNAAALGNSAGSNLGRVLKELERAEKASQVDIEAINRRRGVELTRIIERSFDRMLGALQERFPDVSTSDIETEFQTRIKEVAREYDEDSVT